jgi:hypothetical protein
LVGKRTLRNARKLIFRLKSVTDEHIPFFTSDELPHYADALLEALRVVNCSNRRAEVHVARARHHANTHRRICAMPL